MARAAQTGRKRTADGGQNGDNAAAAKGTTKKVGQLMAERENIEGQADPPELAVSPDDKGREDQPLAAEMELAREQVVAEEEQENKEAGLDEEDEETEAPKKAKAPAKTKKGGRPAKKDAAAEKDDEPMDTEEAAAEEEKPTESKKKNPPGKKTAAAAKKPEASDDDVSSESPKKNDGKKGSKKNDKPAPHPRTCPGLVAKTAAREKMEAESQEEQNGKSAKTKNRVSAPPQLIGPFERQPAVNATALPPPAKRSRPNEVAFQHIPTPSSILIHSRKSKLYESFTDKEYHDVIFTAAGGTKITTHRCVLAKYSSIFRDLFKENTVLPCRILSNDYAPTTIQAALDFMFEKRDSIVGKEAEVFKFAAKYCIRDLLVVCAKHVLVTPSNVCEFIQIAYSNNFEEMKRKCLTILVEKKKEVDPTKFADLPKNILIDFARF